MALRQPHTKFLFLQPGGLGGTAQSVERLYQCILHPVQIICSIRQEVMRPTHVVKAACERASAGPAPPVAGEQRAQRLQALSGAGRKAVLAARILHGEEHV